MDQAIQQTPFIDPAGVAEEQFVPPQCCRVQVEKKDSVARRKR